MNYCWCSFTYLIFVLICITRSDENYSSHCLSTRHHFSTSPAACWWSFSSIIYPETLLQTAERCNLYIFIYTFDQNVVLFTERRLRWRVCFDAASKFALFSVSGLKDEKLIKSKPTWKLKHANSSLVNIWAKFRQYRSLWFRAIPFQSWCVCLGQCSSFDCAVIWFNQSTMHTTHSKC